jgi:hypothetical protein
MSVNTRFKVGDKVLFGRQGNKSTRGTVIKINPKTLKIRQDEPRGLFGKPVGTIWNVLPTLVHPDLFSVPIDPVSAVLDAKDPIQRMLTLTEQMLNSAPYDDPVVGATIVKVRPMTSDEIRDEYWGHVGSHQRPIVLELSTGARLYPIQDDEGNGPGAFAGRLRDGKSFRLV